MEKKEQSDVRRLRACPWSLTDTPLRIDIAERCPYYHLVPKSPRKNLLWRRKLTRMAQKDPEVREAIRCMCEKDLLFYINFAVWTYNPKVFQKWPHRPMITWAYQDKTILAIDDAITYGYDLLIEKSRDMGATYMSLLVMEWRFHFRYGQTFLMVSEKQDLVDKPGNPDCLFWKIETIHKFQPWWLRAKITRRKLSFVNNETGSTMDGTSTTANVGLGGRRTAIFLDEFASVEEGYEVLARTSDTTDCRILNSTPRGIANGFYDMRDKVRVKLRLHWSLHPRKARGLWADADGKLHSTWYDAQVERRWHPMEVAQELDIDYLGSDFQFFDHMQIDQYRKKTCISPKYVGELECDEKSHSPKEFVKKKDGRLKLWCALGPNGRPSNQFPYCQGIDISMGMKASDSVLSVWNMQTGEKVAEFVCNETKPHELAEMAAALGRWFRSATIPEAYTIWEANGPGGLFGDAFYKLGYRNFYWRSNEERVDRRSTMSPGWWSSDKLKLRLIGGYKKKISQGECRNYSDQSMRECLQYIFTQQGKVVHARAKSNIDPSAISENHGDRVIADALALWVIDESGPQPTHKREIPDNCFAARRKAHLSKRKADTSKW